VRAALAIAILLSGCAYLLPASWRSFRADPDEAAPAITRAIDQTGLNVESFHQGQRRILTNWISRESGVTRVRERFRIDWERDEQEGTLTVYVRHEAQEHEAGEGAGSWGATYHDDKRESYLLDLIGKELKKSGDDFQLEAH
jgi:hypothetical protein